MLNQLILVKISSLLIAMLALHIFRFIYAKKFNIVFARAFIINSYVMCARAPSRNEVLLLRGATWKFAYGTFREIIISLNEMS